MMQFNCKQAEVYNVFLIYCLIIQTIKHAVQSNSSVMRVAIVFKRTTSVTAPVIVLIARMKLVAKIKVRINGEINFLPWTSSKPFFMIQYTVLLDGYFLYFIKAYITMTMFQIFIFNKVVLTLELYQRIQDGLTIRFYLH